MFGRFSRALLASLAVGCPGAAEAYCRSRSVDPPVSSCPELCGDEGEPLFWSSTDIRYTFDQSGFAELDDEQLRTLVQASFDTWAAATCDGWSTGLRFTAEDEPVSLSERLAEREERRRNGSARLQHDNIIAHLSEDEWQQLGLTFEAYALTVVRHGASGEIFGADILFNGGKGPLGECLESGCAGTRWKNDLANIATHEVGHFLGLSHSDVPGSSMYCNAEQGETSKRQLDSDDIAGICAIYPPDVPPIPGTKYRVEVSPSCTPLAPTHTRSGASLCLLFAALTLTTRRRRSPRPRLL